jgi:amidase
MTVNPSSLGPPTPAPPQGVSPGRFLSLDAKEARQLLDNGTLTISGLLSQVLSQIKNENVKGLGLGAIVFLAPEHQLQTRAEELEQELQSGHNRGPLHGIPVVLKVHLSAGRLPSALCRASFTN